MARKPAAIRGVNGVSVAKHLDMSKQRFGQMREEGTFSALPDGSFDLDACRIAYIRWLRDDARRNGKAASASRVSDARAREIELRVAKEEGRLIEVERALGIVDEIIGIYRAGYGALPARVTRDVVLRRRIEDECDAIQREVASTFEQRSGDLGEGGEALDDPGEADA